MAALIVLLVALQGRPAPDPVVFDPNSSRPDGTKALRLLLERLGADVRLGGDPQGSVAVLLHDNLSTEQRNKVQDWVRAGGTLVLGDAHSTLVVGDVDDSMFASRQLKLTPGCPSSLASGVTDIAPQDDGKYNAFTVPEGATGCFLTDHQAFLVTVSEGQGRLIEFSDPTIFTNHQLGKSDNSVLLANVLTPEIGSTLTILQPDVAAGGSKTLSDLIPQRIKETGWQCLIALLLLVFWRGRSLGRPVEEPQLVELPASQLVVAAGNLLQVADQAAGAAQILREELRRWLIELLGLPPNAEPRVVAEAVAGRTGINQQRLLAALVENPVEDGKALLQLAQQLEDVHQEVANAR